MRGNVGAGRRRGAARGPAFTLIEVLLAIVIFAIVLVAIHTVFYGAIQLRNKTSESVQQALPLQQTLAILKRDLSNLVLPGGTFFGELQTSQTISGTNSLDLLSPVDDAIIGQSSPAFFTANGILNDAAPWGDVQRVQYYLVPPTNQNQNQTLGKDLIRTVTRNLLPTLQEEPESQWLMGGLQTIAFSYYDGLQWREYWDSTVETNRLPQGIKVELQMASRASDRLHHAPIALIVPMVLQAGTNQTSQTEEGAE